MNDPFNESGKSVIIAGGGFCGTMTTIHLIRKSKDNISITLINKGYPIARGIAYLTYSDQHLLNVEARNMSAFVDQPDHFVNWCISNNIAGYSKEEIPTSYLPRNIYGTYIHEIFEETVKNLPKHISLKIIDDEITDLEKHENNLLVKTAGGQTLRADKFILATGNHEPGLPLLHLNDFLKSKNYFSNPWCENAVQGLNDEDNVLIIGTGLTMVDVVIGLWEKNFKGKIISSSPHGYNILPHKKLPPQRYILDELAPPYNLDNLFQLFYKHIREARKRGLSGETVVDAIRAKTQEIWQLLSLADKKKFMTHLRHLWGVARHRLPAHVHQFVQQMILENNLQVLAGRINTVEEKSDGFHVKLQKRKDQSPIAFKVARIINCTGPETDIRKQKSLLFSNLIQKGFIRSDEMNLGVDATAEGKVIDIHGNVSGQIYAMGSLLKGKLWESTAVPELRIQANRIAELILK